MKKWTLIIFLLLIVIVSGVFFWRIMLSPQYSLKKLDVAVEKHDVTSFKKYIDLDATVDSMIVQTWQYYLSGEATGSRWSEIRSEISDGFLSVVKPNIKEIIKKEVLDYIATGQWSGNDLGNENGISAVVINLVKEKIDPTQWDQQSINYTNIEGETAHVGLTYYDKVNETNFLLEVKMMDMRGYWQIIEIKNVAQILNTYQNIDNL